MTMFKKAERKAVPLKIALTGPSGSIKTYSMLKLARGIVGAEGRIAVIDTENNSASLYAHVTDFDVLAIGAPFEAVKFIEAIDDAVKAEYDILCIDSLSHEWASIGGVLDKKDQLDKVKEMWGNWGKAKESHNRMIDVILQAPVDTICTMRSKMKYELEDIGGKKVPVKRGLEPIQQGDIEYEFMLVFDGDADTHKAKAVKDRTGLFSDVEPFQMAEEHGALLSKWRNEGGEFIPPISTNTRTAISRLVKEMGMTETWKGEVALVLEGLVVESLKDLTEAQGQTVLSHFKLKYKEFKENKDGKVDK